MSLLRDTGFGFSKPGTKIEDRSWVMNVVNA